MTIAELFAYRREHGVCEIKCVNRNGVFEDSFIEPGMKFMLLDIQLDEEATMGRTEEAKKCYRVILDAETYKEHNRKFYTYTYWDNEHNPIWNCEEADMWKGRDLEYLMGTDDPFEPYYIIA